MTPVDEGSASPSAGPPQARLDRLGGSDAVIRGRGAVYSVEHETRYAYTAPVSQSWQLARLTPRKGQFIITEHDHGVARVILPVPSAISKGILRENTGNRYKSRLHNAFNAISAARTA